MMKKLYAFILGMVLCMPVFAQWDLESNGLVTPLVTSAEQFSSPCSDIAEGLNFGYLIDGDCSTFWHANWHSGYTGPTPYYIDIEFVDPVQDFVSVCIGRRTSSTTCQITKLGVSASVDGKTWVSVGEGEYPYTKVGEYLCSKPIFLDKPYKHLRLTRLATSDGNSTWHLGELQVYTVKSEVGKPYVFDQLLTKYDAYYWGDKEFDLGTGFGQYSDTDAADKFLTELEQVYKIMEDKTYNSMTLDEMAALRDSVETHYQAVMDSKVLFSMPTGYYRIISNLKYYTEEDTGETDLDGNPVTTKTYIDKALYSTLEGFAWWGTRDNTDCRQLWKLEMVGNDTRMVNAGTGLQMSSQTGDGITMVDKDTLMRFDYCGTENGKDVFYIRFASVSAESNTYFHQWYHGRGSGTGHTLCTWQATFEKGEPYTSDKGTSEWYLEPVSDEEAQQLIDAFAMVKNHDLLVINYKSKLEEAQSMVEISKDLQHAYLPDTTKPQVTSTSQFSSLWTEPNEGSFDYILDGDSSTYWHSRYSSSKATTGHQASFEITFEEPITGIFQTYVLRRANEWNNHISKMSLYGSNDESALSDPFDTNWELICSNVSTPWYSGQRDQTSQPFEVNTAYKYWRFYEEETQGRDQGVSYTGCSHYATFQIYPSQKAYTTQYEVIGADAVKLNQLTTEGLAKADADVTIDDYNALVATYDSVAAKFVDPTPLRNAMNATDGKSSVIVIGTSPMQWKDYSCVDALNSIIQQATAYDNSGKYTQEETDTLISQIQAAAKNILGSVIKPDVNKWYRIRMGSEELYDTYGWKKTQAIDEEKV